MKQTNASLITRSAASRIRRTAAAAIRPASLTHFSPLMTPLIRHRSYSCKGLDTISSFYPYHRRRGIEQACLPSLKRPQLAEAKRARTVDSRWICIQRRDFLSILWHRATTAVWFRVGVQDTRGRAISRNIFETEPGVFSIRERENYAVAITSYELGLANCWVRIMCRSHCI